MEHLFQRFGHVIPETTSSVGVKILCAGVGAMAAGLVLVGSGIEGMALRGGGIAACGFAAFSLALRVLIREGRRRRAARREEQLRREDEALRALEQARREESCNGHVWSLDDYALNVNVCRWVCGKCGAVTEENPLT